MEHDEYEARRLSFGGVAELYDRWRPSYPAALVDDVIALARRPGEQGEQGEQVRAVEVGAGTGKATRLFAARGVAVEAIEPSHEMAAIARRNLRDLAHVRVTEAAFEEWRPRDVRHDLLFSAQAWHWVDAARAYPVARSALRQGGVLAAFWNRPDWPACTLREPLDEAYVRHAPELELGNPMRPLPAPHDEGDRWADEMAQRDGFTDAEVRSYPWPSRYRAEEYVALLRTHSDHGRLPPERLEALLAAIADVIDAAGGVLELPQRTRLCLARTA